MKKLIALMLTFIMVCSLSVSAWAIPKKIGTETAAETEETEFNWDEIKDFEEVEDGDFYTSEDYNLKFWVPEDLEDVLDQEDIDEGYIGFFMDDDGEEAITICVYDEETTLEDWLTTLETEYGVTGSTICTVNDLNVILYYDEEEDCFFADFATEDGEILEFMYYPYSDEDFYEDIVISLYSIMPAK